MKKNYNYKISFLDYPYPYRAALTVCSDTHEVSVETFESVHLLINTQMMIERNSDDWNRLFTDPDIDKNPKWSSGIRGFGLPIADTMWIFSKKIGLYKGFDQNNDPVPHIFHGKDMRDILDKWFRLGWVDSLHTPSPHVVPRKALETAVSWFKEKPGRKLKVWVNHCMTVDPACIAPDQPDVTLIPKNIIKCIVSFLIKIGLLKSHVSIISNTRPSAFPIGQKTVLWGLTILLTTGILWLLICGVVNGFQKPFPVLIGIMIIGIFFLITSILPLKYPQGDNPDSPYYNADIARDLGIRYYWLLSKIKGYTPLVSNKLDLPIRIINNRRSIFNIVELDDKSKCIAFGRNYRPSNNACKSLELMTQDTLENLCENQGTGILYIHWTTNPAKAFTAKALAGLEYLAEFYRNGKIWVAPTSTILHFVFIRTFLQYSFYQENKKQILEISHVNDPINGAFVPSLDDLSGISFEYSNGDPIDVKLGDKILDNASFVLYTNKERTVISFPLSKPCTTQTISNGD